jgi:hypothetical protein
MVFHERVFIKQIIFFKQLTNVLLCVDLGGSATQKFSDLGDRYSRQAEYLLLENCSKNEYERDVVLALRLTQIKWNEYRYRFGRIWAYYSAINVNQRYYAGAEASSFQIWQRFFEIFHSYNRRFLMIGSIRSGLAYAFRLQNYFFLSRILKRSCWAPNTPVFVFKANGFVDSVENKVEIWEWSGWYKSALFQHKVTIPFPRYHEDWVPPVKVFDESNLGGTTVLNFFKKLILYAPIKREIKKLVSNNLTDTSHLYFFSLLCQIFEFGRVTTSTIKPIFSINRPDLKKQILITEFLNCKSFMNAGVVGVSNKLKSYFFSLSSSKQRLRITDLASLQYRRWAGVRVHGKFRGLAGNERNLGHLNITNRFLEFYAESRYTPWTRRIRFYQFIALILTTRRYFMFRYKASKWQWSTSLVKILRFFSSWIKNARRRKRVWFDLRTSLKPISVIIALFWGDYPKTIANTKYFLKGGRCRSRKVLKKYSCSKKF